MYGCPVSVYTVICKNLLLFYSILFHSICLLNVAQYEIFFFLIARHAVCVTNIDHCAVCLTSMDTIVCLFMFFLLLLNECETSNNKQTESSQPYESSSQVAIKQSHSSIRGICTLDALRPFVEQHFILHQTILFPINHGVKTSSQFPSMEVEIDL